MIARPNFIARSAAILALAMTIAAPASAQSEGRWTAWLGCWTPASTLIRVVGRSATSVVCVLPTSTASAVEVVTVTGGKIVDRTRVDTDGQPHALAKEGCTGFQSAKWSPSGRRVYLKSEFNCSGAPSTHLSAVYAMAGSGEWIDVQGLRVDKNSGVHAVRYRQATDVADLPDEIAQKLQQRPLAKRAAMLAAAEQPSLLDVEEASRELDPSVVSTWLIEADKLAIQRPAQLNAKQLVQLADNGVPGSVIDVMLGLSYPNVLAVNPVNYGVARQNTDSAYMQYGSYGALSSMNPLIGFDRMGLPIYASDASFYGGCSYSPFDMGWNLYNSRYGCGYSNGYGYGGLGGFGFGYGYGRYSNYGGYFGGGPVVVPVGSGGSATTHGRLVNGKGYTQGSDGSATPRANSSQPSSSSAGGGSAPPSSPPPPPPPPRTAEPKKP